MESAGFTQIPREMFAQRVAKTSLASRFSYSTKWKAVLKKVYCPLPLSPDLSRHPAPTQPPQSKILFYLR
jgi:hypothetical protein